MTPQTKKDTITVKGDGVIKPDKPKRVYKRKPKTSPDMITSKDDHVTKPDTPKKGNFYTLERILKENADYNLIIGERGNGKTYAIQEYLIKEFLSNGGQCFLLRRWMEDIKQSNAQNFWDGNLVSKLSDMSKGRFTSIIMRNNRYICVSYDDKGKPIIDDLNTIGYVWDVNESERLKGQSFPYVTNIVYEEFISLSKDGYIQDETTYFLNIISTIVRDRTNVKIWMLGNTVNPYNPYFDHFGIKGMSLNQGEIWTKEDVKTGCKIALEFCSKRRKGDLYGTSAKYFAFGTKDGSADMIISGKWQLPNYPVMKYPNNAHVLNKMGVLFDDKIMIMSLFKQNQNTFLYVQTVKNESALSNNMRILDLRPNVKPNYYTSLTNIPECNTKQIIIDCLNNGKIWYKDNLTGSYFNNFIAQSMNINKRVF